ncbi:AAA-like domain protein [compost metagenome]
MSAFAVDKLSDYMKWQGKIYIGHSNYPGEEERALYIPNKQLLKHMVIVGKTGKGKTSYQMRMLMSIMKQMAADPTGKNITTPSFSFLDPHGDAVRTVVSHMPPQLWDKVHILHMKETDRPRGLNLLEAHGQSPSNIVSEFVALIREVFAGETGNRMDHYMRYGLLTLLEAQPQTILSFEPLFTDEGFRESVLSRVKDPSLKYFWSENGMFAKNQAKIAEIIAPILQKLGPFVTYPQVRTIVGQSQSSINMRRIMDEGKILLIDLSGVPEDIKKIMGATLVNLFYFAAMSRHDIPKMEDRRPHYLICDEISGYASQVMEKILSETRKYGLGLILATQFLKKIATPVVEAIMGNCGNFFVLGLGADDASRMAKWMEPLDATALANLPDLSSAVKCADKNGVNRVFTTKFNYVPNGSDEIYDKILAMSDIRDGRPVAEVEKEIADLLGYDSPSERPTAPKAGNKPAPVRTSNKPSSGKKPVPKVAK